MQVKFGPSGNPDRFYDEGFKSSLDMPGWLSENGLDAYEYNCTKGVKIGEASARKLGENARQYGISLSLHAQYYISLSSPKEETRENSIRYILRAFAVPPGLGRAVLSFIAGALER